MELKYIYQNIAIMLVCYIAGQAGLLLAIPPTNAAAVWPAAGIALAAILIWGNIIIPGLWLGLLLIQISAFLALPDSLPLATVFVLSTIISSGAFCQAWVGAKLLRPIMNKDPALLLDRSILLFCLLAGPVSCIISSSISISTLWFYGILKSSHIPISWSTWWIGDSIGVIVFAPIMLCFFGKPHEIWKQRVSNVAIPLCLLSITAFMVFKFIYLKELQQVEYQFEKNTITFSHALNSKIQSHINTTKSLKEFFDSSSEVTMEDFKVFTQPKISRNPDIKALEWIPVIHHKDRESFEHRLGSRIKIPDQTGKMDVSPAQEIYFPIEYLEPYSGNENALGFDIRHNTSARKAAEVSCLRGDIAVTDGINLVQDEKKQTGIVFYAPVYDKNIKHNGNVDCKSISGFVASVFLLEKEINKIFEKIPELNLLVSITNKSQLVFDNSTADMLKVAERHFPFKKFNELSVADKTWLITFSPSIGLLKYYSSWTIWLVIAAGFIITMFSGIGLLMLTGRTLRTEDKIKLSTEELNNEIKQRKYAGILLSLENKMLEMITQDHSLDEILITLCNEIEQIVTDSICSILLLDSEGMHLQVAAAPSLPGEYNDAINGVKIGSSVGSCGTAAYLNKQVIVKNIEEDPLWDDYRTLALKHGLKACWSTPIAVLDGKVLGTFALYFSEVKEPDSKIYDLLNRMVSVVKIAILRNQTEEKLNFQASHDALTGLINRREFEYRATQLLASVREGTEMHALCFMDLDQFKVVNDNCGHAAGDEMLRQIGKLFQSTVRNSDTLARLGGDEFGLLMEHCSLTDAYRVATSLQSAIQDYQFFWEELSFRVGVSIGLVPITNMTANMTELLKNADVACYIAKEKGSNRIHTYNTEDSEVAHRHGEMQWVTKINQALEGDRFCIYAQFIESLENSHEKHYELLIRMVDDNNKIIPPGAFLPSAERYNLITSIDRWMIVNTFNLLEKYSHAFDKIDYFSINLSGPSLADVDFHVFVMEKFMDSKIPQGKICFEITETAAISNLSTAALFITKMKVLGCRFSLDDFGSGLSSFGYLKNLKVDYLKIDGMFVKDIVDDPIDHAMVKSINEIGQVMGMKTIAEFVENDIIKGMLKEIGVNYAQGYGIGRPKPFKKLLEEYKD